MRRQQVTFFACGLWGAILLAAYWPGLYGAFFFDDGPSILLAPGVRLEVFSWDSLRQAWQSGGAGPSGRPIAQLSFALNYYLNGFSPLAFKSTNLAIHATCGVLVLNLAQALLRATYPTASHDRAMLTAGVVAAVWLLHPIQLLPVLHVVQRMTSLSAMFLMLALWFHIAGRERGGRQGLLHLMVAWAFFWPLSYLSKESGALFPCFVVAWEFIVRRVVVGRIDIFARILGYLSLLGALALTVYLVSDSAQWLWSGYELRTYSAAERLLTEGRVLWFYLGLMLFPRLSSFGLHHDDIQISSGWLTPWTTLPAALGLLLLVLVAWRLRKRAPLAAFGIAWFFIGHVMESTVLPLEIAHEHRNYLPFFGVLLAGVSVSMSILQRNPVSSVGVERVAISVGGAFLIAVALITALRAHQFGEEVRRTLLAAQDHPESASAQYEAGSTLAGIPDLNTPDSPLYARARAHLMAANGLNPAFKMGALSLLYLNCKTGQLPELADMAVLIHRLRDTPFAPGDRSVVYILKEMALNGTLCISRLDMDGLFGASIANASVTPVVRAMFLSWYADYLWLGAHDLFAAREALKQSLALNPVNLSNQLKWAQLMLLSGEAERAQQLLLALRNQHISAQERDTLNELLAAFEMPKP